MPRLLISPAAMNYLPIIIWHLLVLGYLLTLRGKSRATWLFGGWFAALTLLNVAEFLSRALYGTSAGYLYWILSNVALLLDLTLELQFAYRYPRRLFRREGRIVLMLCTAISLGLLALMASELAGPIQATYTFSDWKWSISLADSLRPLLSDELISTVLNPLDRLWLVGVWLRQTVALSLIDSGQPQPGLARWKQIALGLWRPQGADARFARNFAFVIAAAVVIVMSSQLGWANLFPLLSYPFLYPLALLAALILYLDHSPEPSTLMVRLVGISLVSLLVILGLTNPVVLDAQRGVTDSEYEILARQTRTLVRTEHLEQVPDTVSYVARRPATGGLFSSDYQYLRSDEDQALALALQDRVLQRGLVQGAFRDQVSNWIGSSDSSSSDDFSSFRIPEFEPAYRAAGLLPDQYTIRQDFLSEDGQFLYEVGFQYLGYRERLHAQALPLVLLMLGATLALLFIFPRFFQAGFVRPLGQLAEGMALVNEGDLSVSVPVKTEDEIGFLTRAFNTMVNSLRHLSTSLEQRAANQTRNLATLYELTALTNESADLKTMLERSLDKTLEIMTARRGLLYLCDTPDGAVGVAAHRGFSPEPLSRMLEKFCDLPIVSRTLEMNQTVAIPNILQDTPASHREFLHETPAYIGVPIRSQHHVLGALCLFGDSLARYSADDLALLAAIAGQIGIAVESARLHTQLEQAAVLEERQRLARDLHDSVTQALYGVLLFTDASTGAIRKGDTGQALQYQSRLRETTRQALGEMRLLIHDLRASNIHQEGLIAALDHRLETVERRAGFEVQMQAQEPLELPVETQVELYYIAQEALNNSLKHSGASRISIRLCALPTGYEFEIADNGVGFDVSTARRAAGIGLSTMRERIERVHGTLKITSQPGQGTHVLVYLPQEKEK